MARSFVKTLRKASPQIFVAIIASWGYFCLGTVRGWSSPGLPSLGATLNDQNNRPNFATYFDMSDEDLVWIASLPPLCSLFGSFLITYPMEHFGRRKALICLAIPGIIGFMLMGFTIFVRNKSILYLGRILTGLVGGATTPVSQIYISECSAPRIRGILGSFTATFLALGILAAYIIGAFVQWYVLCWIAGCFPIVLIVGMLFSPETPAWLLAHDKEEEARKSLQGLRGKKVNIEKEFQRIKANQEKIKLSGAQQTFTADDLVKGSILKPLGISMGLMFFQQFTGINAIVYYTVNIFRSAGSSIDSRYATIICGLVQFIFTASSVFWVDRFGRRVLILLSGLIVSISLATMGTFFYLQRRWGPEEATVAVGWLPLVSLMVFFASYSSGYANVPFIIMGELFPSRYRSILGSASSSFNFLCTFTIVRCFPAMRDRMGAHGAFWFFMSCTLLSLVFIFFLLPETKGKTLEEIERIFSSKASIHPREIQPSAAASVAEEKARNSANVSATQVLEDENKDIPPKSDDETDASSVDSKEKAEDSDSDESADEDQADRPISAPL